MKLRDILMDIHALEEDLLSFERKYGVRSDVFMPLMSVVKNRRMIPGYLISVSGAVCTKPGLPD